MVPGSARNWIAVNNSPDGGAYDFLTDSEPDSEQNQAVRWCSGIRHKLLERNAKARQRVLHSHFYCSEPPRIDLPFHPAQSFDVTSNRNCCSTKVR
jgi:hypothetical protein